jgi:hypothetical protein
MVDVIHSPPNTIERMESVWAVLSADAAGREGVCAATVGGVWMALVTADEALLSLLIPLARKAAAEGGKTLRLAKFTAREDIEEIVP